MLIFTLVSWIDFLSLLDADLIETKPMKIDRNFAHLKDFKWDKKRPRNTVWSRRNETSFAILKNGQKYLGHTMIWFASWQKYWLSSFFKSRNFTGCCRLSEEVIGSRSNFGRLLFKAILVLQHCQFKRKTRFILALCRVQLLLE